MTTHKTCDLVVIGAECVLPSGTATALGPVGPVGTTASVVVGDFLQYSDVPDVSASTLTNAMEGTF